MAGLLGNRARVALQKLAHRTGHRIERIDQPPANPLNILDLAIAHLMLARGPQLTFVQIGANDGTMDDPIEPYVRKFGWQGLLVEPQPDAFADLVNHYAGQAGLQFENSALAKTDGTLPLYVVRRGDDLPAICSGMASFNRDVIVAHRGMFPQIESRIDEISVPTLCVASLLAKHPLATIDLLQVDTEGFDFEVLKLFDLSTRKIPLVHFEHRHLSRNDKYDCFDHLARLGYRLQMAGDNAVAYLQTEAA